MADDLIPLNPVAPPKVRPRVRWRWARRLGVLSILLLALAWFAPTIAVKAGLTNWLAAKALADFDGTARIGGASLGWLSPVELRDVTLTDAAGRTLLTAPKLTSSKTLLQLARDRSDLGTFTIEQPAAEVVCEKGTTNLEQAIAKYFTGPPTGGRPAVAVRVTGGTLTIHDADRSRKRTLTGVEADVTVPAAPEPIAVKVRSETGKLDADLTVGTEVAGKLTATDFPLDAVEPLARRVDPGLALAGLFSADLTAGLTPRESGLPDTRIAGTLSARDIVITSPRLGPEPVSLRRVELPVVATTKGMEVWVEKANLTCDLGSASFAGTLDLAEPVEKWLDRPGLRATADADVAALAARFPKLLRVRDGLELREGRVRAELTSRPGPGGPTWEGSLKTTALKGVRGGKPLAWDQPVEVSFAGRLGPTRVPAFDRLDVKAEFATVTARGSPERFTANADVSLDRLAARLSEFIDLGGVSLAGTAKVGLTYTPNGQGGAALRGNARLSRFVYADGTRELREPDLVLDVSADGRFDGSPQVRLDTGRATVTAGTDVLAIRLLEPVADVRALTSGKVTADVSGDLARWKDRAARFVSVPGGWQVSGTGKAAGVVRFDAGRIAFEKVAGELTAVKFTGAGLRIDEPQVKVYPTDAVIDRKTGRVEIGEFQAATQTVGLATRQVVLTPTADGGYAVSCTVLANANLARLQRVLGVGTDPVAGLVQAGSVTLDTAGGRYKFKATLPVNNFAYGPPQKPTWAEPKLTVAADGEYDPAADLLRFDSVKVERPAGLAAQAKGSIGKLSTAQELDLSGRVSYDLSLLEPQLRAYLGQGVKAVGKDARDFRITGPLAGGAQNLSASVSGLSGNAAVAWQSLRAYGFDVGRAELKATLDKGTLRVAPVEAAFGQTGKVRLEPSVRFAPAGYDLTFTKGKVVERAKLTPAACADALGYALPAIAKSTEAEGLVSFDLDDNTIPLTDPDRATVKGRLTLHAVQVGPGPVVTELATLFGAKQTKLTLANEQVVPVRLENGRVHHEGMSLTANGFTLRTTGSVGLDGSLELSAEVPVPENAIAQVLKNNPRIREAVTKKRFVVPVGGTISKPKLDPRAFQDAVRRYAEEVAREAARHKLNDVIEKGQDQLEKELQKKLDKLLPSQKQPPPKKD